MTYNLIYNFGQTSSDGEFPYGGALIDAKGNLLGITGYGGDYNVGAAFELSPMADGTFAYETLYSFGVGGPYGTNGYQGPGAVPSASIISDAHGNFYGTTLIGGATDYGTVFRLSPTADGSLIYEQIYDFTASSGQYVFPNSSLALDAHGDLYGVSSMGGTYNHGTIFELMPSAAGKWTEKVLYSFGAPGTEDGTKPQAGLILDPSGNLYGTTTSGGKFSQGTVFELSAGAIGSWTEKLLHSFDSNADEDGADPQGSLVFDNEGNLYGTTYSGGYQNYGTVFELSPASGGAWTEKVFSTYMNAASGTHPEGPLTMDAKGNLYGTASSGGFYQTSENPLIQNAGGTVFEITPVSNGTWLETTLISFDPAQGGGALPQTGVLLGYDGELYGTTQEGGPYGANRSGGPSYENPGEGIVFGIKGAAPATPVSTTTTLLASPNTGLVAGEPITLTATVAPVSGPAVPAGLVVFVDPALPGRSVTALLVDGVATYTGTVPPTGSYSLQASYSGAPGFDASNSAVLTGTVTAPPPQ